MRTLLFLSFRVAVNAGTASRASRPRRCKALAAASRTRGSPSFSVSPSGRTAYLASVPIAPNGRAPGSVLVGGSLPEGQCLPECPPQADPSRLLISRARRLRIIVIRGAPRDGIAKKRTPRTEKKRTAITADRAPYLYRLLEILG